VQKFIESGFQQLRTNTLSKITNENQNRIGVCLNEVNESFKLDSAQLIGKFEVLVQSHPDSKYLVMQGVGKFLTELLNSFDIVEPQFMLLAYGVCHIFSTVLIPFIYELVARFDPESPVLNMKDSLQNDSSGVGDRCVQRFVENKRKMLSQLIGQGMKSSDWQENKAPSDVSISSRLVIAQLCHIWTEIEDLVQHCVNDDHNSSGYQKSPRFSSFSGTAANVSQVPVFHGLREDNLQQIDRLFTTVNRLHLGRKCEFSSKSILTNICLFSVKTLLEYVRLNTFSSEGFKQMQIDCYFVYMAVFDKVEEIGLLNVVLEEVLSSAADRTIEPIPLQVAVLSDIYSRSDCKPQPGIVEE
jgi:hypothetical protein